MTGQEVTKLQHSDEFVKEEGTAEVRQTSMFTGDFILRGEYFTLRKSYRKVRNSSNMENLSLSRVYTGFVACQQVDFTPDLSPTALKSSLTSLLASVLCVRLKVVGLGRVLGAGSGQ